jgi:protocatechuate 3,4-dioxygenase beta subunit
MNDRPPRKRRFPAGPLVSFSLALLAVGAGILASSAGAARSACPTVNRPNMLRIVAGSPQTAQLEKPFQTNLQVTLANSNGCPLTGQLGGVWVDFNAPASGASGSFATSGTNRVTVGTDATGTASAPTFTANDLAGSYSVQVDSDYGSVLLYLTNTASGVVASIATTGPTRHEATVNSHYAEPLQVQVLDANGRPVQGATVTFSLGTGSTGASAAFVEGGAQSTVTTRTNGQATSPAFVANGTPGRFTATASSTGAGTAATFTLVNHAAGASRMIASSSSALSATVQTRYRQPLAVRVFDANAQPIEGASITFTLATAASGAGATFLSGESQATRLTGADGRATSPALVANKVAGRFTAAAALTGGNTVTYSLRNVAGRPAAINAGGASGQSAALGARFSIRFAVTVSDADNNPVSGAVVTFTAPTRGPSGHFLRGGRRVRVTTNAKGIAIAPAFTANRTPGGYVVTASAEGERTAFALVNRPRA